MEGKFPEPRPFQAAAHEALRKGFRDGHRCQMLCSPTGSGKTFLALRLISEALARGKRAIFVADRITLIDQTSTTADRYGLSDHGIIQADHWRTDYSKKFQIASAQSLERRQWPEADVIVIDEAHTMLGAWVDHIPTVKAAVIGLSATPFSDGLGKLFSNLVNAATMDDLTKSGVLVPLRILTCARPDMGGAKTSGGEWTEAAAAERGMAIIGDVVATWQRVGENRKTIVFGSTIAHCEELCRQFNEAGVQAACFTADTPKAERETLLKQYRADCSPLRVLISVEALAKGFDVPDVGCVVDCRPLRKSFSTFIQMIGRGLRSSPGKQDCILIDHSGNVIRFAQDFENLFYNGAGDLSDAEKLDKSVRKDDEDQLEDKGCPECGYTPFRKRCMACGYERQASALVEHEVGGEVREITIGKARAADSPWHLWQQTCEYARTHSAPDKAQGRAAHIYKDIVGAYPPRDWHISNTPSVPITPAVAGKIRSRNIAFAHSRGLRRAA